ncbi:MAG: hypothetical protein BWY26_01485 [Elusimicrobia bacterium ADurb.Bin231]|nr:MAG: hypothetical protein BWY26_01485 [Elusimicrobia bacterium ADurb.Bin231]
MKKGHVFIVNEESLPIHLKYMFVGVSSGEKDNNIGLLADICRVKKDDFIFFYIEGRSIKKGRFFGVFKAVDDVVYHITGNNAKNPNLPVKLIYRKKIKPYKVYSNGVLEWEALDKLPTYAKELLWTLIYRKMKGGRGNTMLFPWETERLISLIENINNGSSLNHNDLDFHSGDYRILKGNGTVNYTINNIITIPLAEIKKSETGLQAYILQQLKIGQNNFLPQIFGNNIVWIGNEVFAGTGMQKIDIVTIEKIDEISYLYRLIELKHPKSSTNINFAALQLEYYINWAREDIGGHIIGGKKFNIKPILLSLAPEYNSVSENIITDIKKMGSISNNPEIWEVDFSFNMNKIL